MVAGYRRGALGLGAIGMLGLMGAAMRVTDYGALGVGIDPVEEPQQRDWHVYAYNDHLERQARRKRIAEKAEAERQAKFAKDSPIINAAEAKRLRKQAKRLGV